MIWLMVLLFIIGYTAIALEHPIKINKAASAIITGALLWAVYILSSSNKEVVSEELAIHLGDLSGVLFFLLGAMTIVELIDSHDGFDIITERISQTDIRKLLWIVAFITFFLSSILDNLTTTIVIISLLRKLIRNQKDRLFFAGVVVMAANSGGAWTPIGDVTTTMLWIGGQISTFQIMTKLILPSLMSLVVPLVFLSFVLKGKIERPLREVNSGDNVLSEAHRMIVFVAGISALVLVPVFKTITHLPPYMGILFGLGIVWIITEVIHGEKEEKDRHKYTVVYALRRIDTASILFFFGILISIAALQSVGILAQFAQWMTNHLGNENIIVISIGLLSSIIDNVPLVAAAQGMYDLTLYPTDHYFWEFLAYCAGTGGSILIIGSAAGVAAMGLEKINFIWYLKRISLLALMGYFAGALTYILQHHILLAYF